MIPTIGTMIGVYIILRCLDLMAAAQTRYAAQGVRVPMIVACVLTILITGFLLIGLVLGSTNVEVPKL